jgi:hypothetical protein
MRHVWWRVGEYRYDFGMPAAPLHATPNAAPPRPLQLGRLAFEKLAWQFGPAEVRVTSLELLDVVVLPPSTPPAGDDPVVPTLQAARARLQGVAISLATLDAAGHLLPATRAWRLEALEGLQGRIEALITDAHWTLDADVTLPIAEGRIDFNRVTVEHVGPDSSMGISPMGLYVDAPNGRNYLYLFNTAHVPGATFEQRGGSLFGAGVADRGALQLRPLVEGLLCGMTLGNPGHSVSAQIDRTRLSGMLQLGDGALGAGGHEVRLEGRAQGRNRLSLAAEAAGQELTARLPEFSASDARFEVGGQRVTCGRIGATLSLKLARRAATLVADDVTIVDLAVGSPLLPPFRNERRGP